MNTGTLIRNRRKSLNMSADALAEKIGKDRATIYRYENGDIENLPSTLLGPIATALETTPAYLMGWTDDPTNVVIMEDIFDRSVGLEYVVQRINFYTYIKDYCWTRDMSIEQLFIAVFEYVRQRLMEGYAPKTDHPITPRNFINKFRTVFIRKEFLDPEYIDWVVNSLGCKLDIFDQKRYFIDANDEYSLNTLKDKHAVLRLKNHDSKSICVDFERDVLLLYAANRIDIDEFRLMYTEVLNLQYEIGYMFEDKFTSNFLEFVNGKIILKPLNSSIRVMQSTVPVFGRIPAGIPFEALNEAMDDVSIPDWLAAKKDLFGLLVLGDSMNKIIPDGAIAVLQRTTELNNGEIGAVMVNGFDATLKKFFKLTDSIVLEPISYNPENKPIVIGQNTTEVKIIGKLLWYCAAGEIK